MFHSNKEARDKIKELAKKEANPAQKPPSTLPNTPRPAETIAPPADPVPTSVTTNYIQPNDGEASQGNHNAAPIYKNIPSDPGFYSTHAEDDVMRPYRPPVPRQESVERYLKRSNSTEEKLPPNWSVDNTRALFVQISSKEFLNMCEFSGQIPAQIDPETRNTMLHTVNTPRMRQIFHAIMTSAMKGETCLLKIHTANSSAKRTVVCAKRPKMNATRLLLRKRVTGSTQRTRPVMHQNDVHNTTVR